MGELTVQVGNKIWRLGGTVESWTKAKGYVLMSDFQTKTELFLIDEQKWVDGPTQDYAYMGRRYMCVAPVDNHRCVLNFGKGCIIRGTETRRLPCQANGLVYPTLQRLLDTDLTVS